MRFNYSGNRAYCETRNLEIYGKEEEQELIDSILAEMGYYADWFGDGDGNIDGYIVVENRAEYDEICREFRAIRKDRKTTTTRYQDRYNPDKIWEVKKYRNKCTVTEFVCGREWGRADFTKTELKKMGFEEHIRIS